MIRHSHITKRELFIKMRQGEITLGGNTSLTIYGTLRCNTGKRMKKINRVFFQNEAEAIHHGYRPCGHCLKADYLQWKSKQEAG